MINRRRNVNTASRTAYRSHVICVLLVETDHAAVVLLNRILTGHGRSLTSVQSSSEINEALKRG